MPQNISMSSKQITKMFLITVGLTLGASPALAKGPVFSVNPVSIPVGAGLPNGKMIDIAGFHAGMNYKQVEQVLSSKGFTKNIRPKYYKQKMPFANEGWMSSMYYNRKESNSRHNVQLIFSSNASANELYGIYRVTYFNKGQEASVADYISAIENKYGKASSVKDSTSSRTYHFAYNKGQQKFHADPFKLCPFNVSNIVTELTYPSFHNKKYRLAPSLAKNETDANHCSVYMRITFGFRREANGQINKDYAKYVSVNFLDASRMYKSYVRDVQVMNELKDKASKATRPANPSKPSL